MTRNITCIICPRGCAMTAEITAAGVTVTGHTCARGEEYAVAECTNPVRTVTATVRVSNRTDTMVSVKTAAPVPKELVFDVMRAINAVRVPEDEAVGIGDVIISDVCGTGVGVVATSGIF